MTRLAAGLAALTALAGIAVGVPNASAAQIGLPAVWPTPQQVTQRPGAVGVPADVTEVTSQSTDPAALSALGDVLRSAGVRTITQVSAGGSAPHGALTIYVGTPSGNSAIGPELTALGAQSPAGLASGGYTLAAGKGAIVLAGVDGAGTFYAVQTLRQLIGHRTVPDVVIRDWPSISVRGVIEGFYGPSWSDDEIASQLQFYGANKLNTFVYSAKNDPYLRSQWQDLYPAAQLSALGQLVTTATDEHVNFVYALSPGLSICYSDPAALAQLEAKDQQLWDVGVRQFALFFDDIGSGFNCSADTAKFGSSPDPLAAAQAYLLNEFVTGFIDTHAGAQELITVPTDYAGDADSAYRDVWKASLNPNVLVYWTGVGVIPQTITAAQAQATAAEFGHQIVVWAELADALDRDLAERGATRLLAEVELPLVQVLAEMERAGIAADTEHFAAMSASLGGDVKAAEQAAFAAVGHEFNLGSPKQLQEVLFTELRLPKTKRIKTGYTTDSEALTSLLVQTEHPVLEHLLRHRDVARLKSVVDSLIPMADADGRIHTTYNQMIAATGRLSSTDPNLQNIPIRTEEGRRIRQGFVVGRDYEYLLTADYSQIELRIMAHLSADQALAEAFSSGHDFHAATAGRVFGVAPEQVTAELRSKVKAMNYGLAYGLSAYGLSQQLRVTPEEARGYMDEYFEQFGGVRDYLRNVVARARMDGYTETMLGRRRYLPDLTSDNRQRREMAERMALNAPIQGSAADIIKVAMLTAHYELQGSGLKSRMLLQVHDELLFEVAPGELDAVQQLVRVAMGGAAELSVPLEVSMGWGRSWADAAH